MRGQLYENFAVIEVAMAPRYRSLLHQTVDQFHGAVMAKAKPVRERGNGGANPLGQAFNGQQELVLLRLDVTGTSGFLAEVQELADAVAEFRKLAIACLGNRSWSCSRANLAIAGNHFSTCYSYRITTYQREQDELSPVYAGFVYRLRHDNQQEFE